MEYTRIVFREREEISRWLAAGMQQTAIAMWLARSESTISREVARVGRAQYRAEDAEHHMQAHRRMRTSKIAKNNALRVVVHEKLNMLWSPEQIAAYLKDRYGDDMTMRASHETIYAYLYVLPRGALKKDLIRCLRQKRSVRGRRKNEHQKRGKIPDMVSIHERPKETEDRRIPGHWEGDLIVGPGHRSALGTLVERTTRTTILVPLRHPDSYEVRKAFARAVAHLPARLKKSLTYDQGTEMSQHKLFTKETKVQVYFADPHSPWQRGTNENTNGLIRQFFPKGTDFKKVPLRAVRRAEQLLNGRPRKTLGWRTPVEAFNQLLALEP